jgi:hypothetical protein
MTRLAAHAEHPRRAVDSVHLMPMQITLDVMRTTVDLDEPVLRDLKRLQKQENKTLGRLISELVSSALAARRKAAVEPARELTWLTRPMNPRIDLSDKDALYKALDDDTTTKPSR